jgi:hypothetical protein
MKKIMILLGALPMTTLLMAALLPSPGRCEGTEPPPIPRTRPLTYYTSLVNSVLPSFDGSMLAVANGPDWMAGKTVHQVATAVQDSDPGTIVSDGPVVMGYDPPDGPRRIKLDFSEGYVRYTNRLRSYHSSSPCAAVPTAEAENALVATLGVLGLPTAEWDARRVDTVMERSVDGEGQDPTVEPTCEIEQIVTMTRKASNGMPVFDSAARESVSNLHERARLMVDWPQFIMPTGLLMRSRAEVVNDLGQQIFEAESDQTGLGADVDLEIFLGYTKTSEGYRPVARAVFADTYARYAGEVLHIPLAYDASAGVRDGSILSSVQLRARPDAAAGATLLEFYLPGAARIRLRIVDAGGREVTVLAEREFAAGWNQVPWNERDAQSRRAASGVYFAHLEAGGRTVASKILIVR